MGIRPVTSTLFTLEESQSREHLHGLGVTKSGNSYFGMVSFETDVDARFQKQHDRTVDTKLEQSFRLPNKNDDEPTDR